MTLLRLSPLVQRIQANSPYIDIYTNASTSPLRSRSSEKHATLTLSHAHPEPKRWENAGGWGARHINDKAPFNLWDENKREYRMPTGNELKWLRVNFGDGQIGMSGWYLWIETAKPPQPVPLTVGCMPVMFIGIGEEHHEPIPQCLYPSPRIGDPCPTVRWAKMEFPTKEQNAAILTALQPLASVREIIYMPHWTIVELEYGDGRHYEPRSLPGTVAGRTTLYHHAEARFYKSMKNMTRARRIDPAQHPPMNLGPMPQDAHNYLRQTSHLSPGCRLEYGFGMTGSHVEGINAATSAGVKLRRVDGQEVLTASHHGFLISSEVYHPFAGEDKIGDIIDTRPQLDIALVRLTPTASAKFTNTCYFQAETPRTLLRGSEIIQGSWSEVDGMSSGLVTLLTYGRRFLKPKRPAGHPEIDFREWQSYSVDAIFGAVNNTICEGMCGAPIVQCEAGGVGGFFHLSDGVNCFTAHLDDLVAEGWEVA
ncbi:hypothetical protein GLAREA_11599 [Glarea lozoyensis ATCC 20868]|uniref:Uncharacterized protein n=1 Tax=Glarea lozoyensis (strain ATCC 20868 / MF5171) TaxID=1116229 RepID=S3DEC7_GLAL2|nr:uncharacterized protein GLAREA_11599 [Glarea lozoyensis ATCC 20868]EPE25018.1 hypothetical protein GLAREA_11599 [Glarea lozoyensis ATCC 20868]